MKLQKIHGFFLPYKVLFTFVVIIPNSDISVLSFEGNFVPTLGLFINISECQVQ